MAALACGVLVSSTFGQNAPLPIDPCADLTELNRLTHPMVGTTGQTSSYDRSGGNGDASFWYYLRAEPKRVVMADVRGPGCISRIWVTAFDSSVARIEVFVDGSSTPAVSAWMRDFFGNGALPPFVPPLASSSTGSWVSYVPIPFRKSCRIEAINARADNNVIYYNVSYRAYPPGETLADVFHMPPTAAQQAHLDQFAQQWANRGQDPKGAPPGQQVVTGSVFVDRFGGTATLANLGGAGAITGIRLSINPNAADSLFHARIRCRWDGSVAYVVDSPLGAFFGSGFGPANARALALGTSDGQMYCYLPMPYSNGAMIEIVNPSSTPISSASYTITYAPKDASQIGRMRFHAVGRSQTPASGGMPSYRILNTTGKGHFLGTVIAIESLDPNWGPLEGDEYIYVNGENNASIRGTGAEDYFNGGFYFSGGPVSLPFNGCSVITQSYPLRMSAYRLSIPDAVVFRNGLIADLEHGGVNEANANYYSTALYFRDDGPGGPPADPVNAPLPAGSLVNGDFDNGFSGYNSGEANGWIAYQSRGYYGGSLCTFSAGSDQAYSGTRSQKIILATPGSGSQSAGIAQQVPVARGSSYQVAARLRVSVAGSLQAGDVIARLGLGTNGNTYFEEPSVSWTNAPAPLNTWHTLTTIATASSDFLTVFAGGQYRPAGVPGPATVWVDSVTIQPYNGPLPDPPPPVIDNPSFESAVSPWAMWTGPGGNGDGLERDFVGAAPDGSYALAVKGLGNGGKGAYEYVASNWVTNRQYRLSAEVRNLSNSGMRYAIGYTSGNLGPAGAAGAVFGAEVTGTSSWQPVSVQLTFAGSDEGVTIYLKAIHAGSSERAGFDRVVIEDITPDGPPALTIAPPSFSRTIRQGSSPASDAFTVQNTGGSTLSYSITENVDWLSVGPASGASTGEVDPIAITYATADLPPATYNAIITISAPGAVHSPQTVAVNVTVEQARIPGDFDHDSDVDLVDFGHLQACITGSNVAVVEPTCDDARFDADADVDGYDVALWIQCMTAPNVPGEYQCLP